VAEEADASNLGPWRQGSVLPQGLALKLGLLIESEAAERCAVLISHDCDITNSVEPDVEVIVGCILSAADGTLTAGKSARTLHLPWNRASGPRVLELKAAEKRKIPKTQLVGERPDSTYRLEETAVGLFVLRTWLALRYNRASFPDEFNARLQRTKAGRDMLRVLRNHPQITGVYVKLNTRDELPTEASAPYEVDMFLAFDPGDDPEQAQTTADNAAGAIETAFASRCYRGDPPRWEWLVLKSCTAVSEADFPIARAKQLQHLNLDYLSFRGDKPEPAAFGAVNR